jgi:hypothetical protein
MNIKTFLKCFFDKIHANIYDDEDDEADPEVIDDEADTEVIDDFEKDYLYCCKGFLLFINPYSINKDN